MGDILTTADITAASPGDKNTLTPVYVRDAYIRGSKALKKERYEYAVNSAFLAGEQWLYFDNVRNTIQSLPRDPSRTRLTINRLWPTSRSLMSKLLSRPLVFEVPPGGYDDASIKGAHVGEAVIQDLYREHDWENLRENLAWDAWKGGTAILAVDWDATKGSTLGVLPITGKPFGTGEIVESALSICEVAWEPGTKNAEFGNWWVRAQVLPPAEVKAAFNLDKMPAADILNMQTPETVRLTRDSKNPSAQAMTLVLTYYERPNALRPQGAVATVVGERFVDGPKDWTFPFKDRLNIAVIRETKNSSNAAGTTVLSAAVPVQVAYNASWSHIVEHMKLAGNARLMIPDASLDDIEDLTDLPSEVISYNAAGGKPDWLSPPQMPQWWVEQPQMLANEMDDILGQHDVSRGQAPTNVDSGVGLSVLVEQDSSPLGKLTREMVGAFERTAQMCLQIYEVKVKETRKARLIANSIPETVNWTGEALQGQTRVNIPIDAVMPRSHAAMFALAQNLWDRKIINSPEQFTQIAQLPDQDHLLESMDLDSARARRENDELAMNIPCLPEDFDNHTVHIQKHNDFRKSARFESLSPEIKDMIKQHIQAHENMAAEQAGLQVAKGLAHPVLPGLPTAADAAPLPPGVPMSPGEMPLPPEAVGAIPPEAGNITPQAPTPQGP